MRDSCTVLTREAMTGYRAVNQWKSSVERKSKRAYDVRCPKGIPSGFDGTTPASLRNFASQMMASAGGQEPG